MKELKKERMLELLSDKILFGLNDDEHAELAELEKEFHNMQDDSLEITAAILSLTDLEAGEPMPTHLNSKILADAEQFFAPKLVPEKIDETPEELQKIFAFEPKRASIWQWLGWLVAALACIVLAINLWTTRRQATPIIVKNPPPIATPIIAPTIEQQRAQLLASASDLMQSNWTDFDPKQPRGVTGDIVWSSAQQKGFARFRGLPVNDKNVRQYQIWIFDENQNAKTPIDGGVFDVNRDGEIIVPLDAAIKVGKPKMFGVTAEKAGGVVVSDLKNVMAVAKITT